MRYAQKGECRSNDSSCLPKVELSFPSLSRNHDGRSSIQTDVLFLIGVINSFCAHDKQCLHNVKRVGSRIHWINSPFVADLCDIDHMHGLPG